MKTKYKILIAQILFYFFSFFLIKTKFVCKRCNVIYNLDLREAIDLHIFIFGKFESEIINSASKLNLTKKKIIIDIGSNIGVQTFQFASQFENSKVYSIEPTNYAYKKLISNLFMLFNCEFQKNYNLFL
jgi:hypothetical protein